MYLEIHKSNQQTPLQPRPPVEYASEEQRRYLSGSLANNMLSTGVPKVSVKMCHVGVEALGIQPDVKQRDHASHYDQELEKKGTRKEVWRYTSDMVRMWEE